MKWEIGMYLFTHIYTYTMCTYQFGNADSPTNSEKSKLEKNTNYNS